MTAGVRFGLTLSNRMVVLGGQGLQDILAEAEEAEATGLFDSLWVGDSLLAKRRAESVVLLSALASRTRRVRLGVGCMASFPLRHPVVLALQWATLDLLAGPGRLILAACLGGRRGGGDWQMEQEALGVPNAQRVGRLEEGIQALRALWTQSPASFTGRYYRFQGVVLEPRPATRPHPPIWIASNPRPSNGDTSTVERGVRRVARLADGWMTTLLSPETFRQRWAEVQEAMRQEGRDPAGFETYLYYNANINEDREAAFRESKRYLDLYYNRDWPPHLVDLWVAYGAPQEVVERIGAFVDAGVQGVTIRLTSWDHKGQFRRLVREVLPAFNILTR